MRARKQGCGSRCPMCSGRLCVPGMCVPGRLGMCGRFLAASSRFTFRGCPHCPLKTARSPFFRRSSGCEKHPRSSGHGSLGVVPCFFAKPRDRHSLDTRAARRHVRWEVVVLIIVSVKNGTQVFLSSYRVALTISPCTRSAHTTRPALTRYCRRSMTCQVGGGGLDLSCQ